MNGYKQISLITACYLHSITVLHEVITISNKDRFHARFPVNASSQRAAHSQSHVFFPSLAATYCTWIASTVTGIDYDHNIPTAHVCLGGSFDRLRRAFTVQVYDKPISVPVIGTGGKTSRTHGLIQIKNNPQLPVCPHTRADGSYRTASSRQLFQRGTETRVFKVNHQAVGAAHGEDIVF